MPTVTKHERLLARQRRRLELLLLALPPRRLVEERCHLLHLLDDDLFEDRRPAHRWGLLVPLPYQLLRLQCWGRWIDAALPPPPPVVLGLADILTAFSPPPPREPS